MPSQTITDWRNFTLYFTDLASCLLYGFLQMWEPWSPKETQNLDSSQKIIWFHWSTYQFWWSQAYIERFRFWLNFSSGFEIGIPLSNPRWWNLPSVVDWETATFTSFQALEISLQSANRLEIRILFSWRSFQAVVLGLKLQLDHFK